MVRSFSFLLAIVAIVTFSHVRSDDGDVLDLSDNTVDTFKSTLAQHDAILVEFFAPWCGHCKRLAPEFAKAATALKSADPAVPLAKVDCTTDGGKDICQDAGVSGYPTLKIFRSGEFSMDYSGPRDADGIVKYMRSQVGPASKELKSYSELSTKVKESKETVVVGLFSSDADGLYSKFKKAADKLRESVLFVHIFADSASGDVPSDFSSYSVPAVVIVRPAAYANKFEPNSVALEGDDDVVSFVKSNYHGLVGIRSQSNMDDFKGPLVTAYFPVDYIKNPKGTNYWRNRVLKVAKGFYPKVNFAVSDVAAFGGEVDEFGLKPSSGKDATPVVGAKDEAGKKYVMNEKFSVESFQSFVENFAAGRLEPHVKSEDIPEDNNGPVKTAVGKNFDDLITNTDKDVLIEFYAPWCGHCKKLAPTWEELGQAMEGENVVIAKMDATANDVPAAFVVHGFPTIYYYPADTKIPKKYEGGREVDDFVKYLAKNANLKGYDSEGQKVDSKDEL